MPSDLRTLQNTCDRILANQAAPYGKHTAEGWFEVAIHLRMRESALLDDIDALRKQNAKLVDQLSKIKKRKRAKR